MNLTLALPKQNLTLPDFFFRFFKFFWEVEQEVVEQKEVVFLPDGSPEEGGSNRKPLIKIIILSALVLGGYIFRSDIYNFVFASNDTEESVQEDNEGNAKEEVALEEVISIIEEGDTSGIDQDLVAKMRSVKERTKKLDDKYLSGSIQESTYGRRLINLNDEAWPLLQEYLRAKRASQKNSQTVPEPVPENPALAEAFDKIMEARERRGEVLGEAYLSEQISSEEYDVMFADMEQEAEYLLDNLIRFIDNPEVASVDEVAPILERYNKFLEVEELPQRGHTIETSQGNPDDASPELSQLLEEIRDIKIKADKLTADYKDKRITKKAFKDALLNLQTTFYKLLKKVRDFVEINYQNIPPEIHTTNDNIAWSDKVIRCIGSGKDMPMFKRSMKLLKDTIKKFEEIMKQNFRNPTLGE